MTKLTDSDMNEALSTNYSETWESDEDLLSPNEYDEWLATLTHEGLKEEYNSKLGWMEHNAMQ